MAALPFVVGLLGWRNPHANIADSDNKTSCRISAALLHTLEVTRQADESPQSAGRILEHAVREHLDAELPQRIGGRNIEVRRNRAVADFDQYTHLAMLRQLIDEDETETLRATIGTDYMIRADVTVGLASQRGAPSLHAAVPCKWTLRSDRAQNVRHEAVTMIRLRRGRLPHITPVTAEPMPTRIASLARGTGEVDVTYHVALEELTAAVRSEGTSAQVDALDELVGHGRLRDLGELVPTLRF